jgi:diguanylate cyclase (GGDEF)-like protein/putative nucleotidyltransferase with HDIG domain
LPDVDSDPDYVPGTEGIQSELAIPVLSGGRSIAVCNFESRARLPKESIELLSAFADACAAHLDLPGSTQEVELRAIARILVHATAVDDLHGLAELAARTLGRLFHASAVQVNTGAEHELIGSWSPGRTLEPLPNGVVAALADGPGTKGLFTVVDSDEAAATAAPTDRQILVIRLRAGGIDVGVAVVRCTEFEFAFERVEMALLIAAHTAASIESAQALQRERRAATSDAITGLLNRRGFEQAFEDELTRCRRLGIPLTLALFDCDDFKRVNDAAGHPAGDELLRRIGGFLSGDTRNWDRAARLGGDEFAVLFPETDHDEAVRAVSRLRRGLGDVCADAGFTLTASFGLATYPTDGVDAETLLTLADKALYGAKGSGKDRALGYTELRRLIDEATDPAVLGSLVTLVGVMDAGYLYDGAHSQVVARLAQALGEALGEHDAQTERLYLAGLLHDIGKAGIPESILKKPAGLTDPEWLEVKRHPVIGAHMLERLRDEELANWIRWHHERIDGSGYPDGLGSSEIPLGARILAVADAYEAMTSERPYRHARSHDEAIDELRAHAGSQFDPSVVEALAALPRPKEQPLPPAVLAARAHW